MKVKIKKLREDAIVILNENNLLIKVKDFGVDINKNLILFKTGIHLVIPSDSLLNIQDIDLIDNYIIVGYSFDNNELIIKAKPTNTYLSKLSKHFETTFQLNLIEKQLLEIEYETT